MSETKFKRWFRSQWTGWSETYEPGRGSGMGIPDVQILVTDFKFGEWGYEIDSDFPVALPIEMKIGKIEDHILKPKDIRPDQIGWHDRFSRRGAVSIFLIGVQSKGSWRVFGINGKDKNFLANHKAGWYVGCEELHTQIEFQCNRDFEHHWLNFPKA